MQGRFQYIYSKNGEAKMLISELLWYINLIYQPSCRSNLESRRFGGNLRISSPQVEIFCSLARNQTRDPTMAALDFPTKPIRLYVLERMGKLNKIKWKLIVNYSNHIHDEHVNRPSVKWSGEQRVRKNGEARIYCDYAWRPIGLARGIYSLKLDLLLLWTGGMLWG